MSLVEGDLAIESELDRDGSALLAVFGGIAAGVGIAPFEFRRITSGLSAKTVFVRDLEQAWYHGELPGIGRGLPDLARFIDRVRESSGATRLVCVGNSMGGYAALAVGSMVGADEVIAFAPQAFISSWLRFRVRDARWSRQIRKARRSPFALKTAFDLKHFLASPGFGTATVYAATEDELDIRHCKRLERVPRLRIRWVEGGHRLVKKLRDEGELEQLLLKACGSA